MSHTVARVGGMIDKQILHKCGTAPNTQPSHALWSHCCHAVATPHWLPLRGSTPRQAFAQPGAPLLVLANATFCGDGRKAWDLRKCWLPLKARVEREGGLIGDALRICLWDPQLFEGSRKRMRKNSACRHAGKCEGAPQENKKGAGKGRRRHITAGAKSVCMNGRRRSKWRRQ